MSEEEIIKILKELISWKVESVEIKDYEIEAMQGLLDLYNKEKEKNTELEKLFKKIDNDINARKSNLEGMYKLGYNECKMDYRLKIKEKIELLDKLELLGKEDYPRIKFAIDILQKLLKEEQ